MKTVANLFSTAYTRLGADHQKDRHFMTIERLAPEEDGYGTYVKSVAGLAQNEYWIAREKNILMLLKKTPHIVRLRKEEKTNNSYQTVKTKDAGISLAHWLGTKPTLAATKKKLKHPLEPVGAFLNFTKYCLIALKGLHQAGVIHANLRPDNICIPYAPRPYEFDTELKLDYEGLALIDFMFSISSTLKLSRALPISISTTPSTQSDLVLIALAEDRKNRNTDFIQRIDYSVDLYALGYMLDQIFQQNLLYPDGLDAELSMEIHTFIHELKSYQQGVPDNIKMRFLHLLPHDDYIQRIEHLLSLDYRSTNADSKLFTFDPAQFLEDDAIFSADNGLSLAPELDTTVNNEKESDLPLTVSTPREKTTMKDTMPSSSAAKDATAASAHLEIDKSLVIIVIAAAQVLLFVYQEGALMGLDVPSTMGLILLISVCAAFAGKLFTPKSTPRPRPTILDPVNRPMSEENAAAPIANENRDEFDLIDASVPIMSAAKSEDTAPITAAPVIAAGQSHVVLLKTDNTPPIVTPEKDEHIELNKWVVIAVIVIFQLALFFLTTDISPPKNDGPVAVSEGVAPEPVAEETLAVVAEEAPVEPAVIDDAAAANITLLSEVSSVSTPQVTPQTATSQTATATTAKPKAASTPPVAASITTPAIAETSTPKTKVVAVPKEKIVKEKVLTEAATPTLANKTETETKTETTAAEKAETPVAVVSATPAAAAIAETKADVKTTPANKSLTQGLAEAQNTMGWHYYHGSNGVKQDREESFKWFQKASNLGQPSAQLNLGMMYAAGTGTKQDFVEAAKWYKKSADQGNVSAQLNLGMMYVSGRGIRQNLPEGVKWLNKAADQGDSTAKANLIWLTQQGYVDNVAAPAEDTANK